MGTTTDLIVVLMQYDIDSVRDQTFPPDQSKVFEKGKNRQYRIYVLLSYDTMDEFSSWCIKHLAATSSVSQSI